MDYKGAFQFYFLLLLIVRHAFCITNQYPTHITDTHILQTVLIFVTFNALVDFLFNSVRQWSVNFSVTVQMANILGLRAIWSLLLSLNFIIVAVCTNTFVYNSQHFVHTPVFRCRAPTLQSQTVSTLTIDISVSHNALLTGPDLEWLDMNSPFICHTSYFLHFFPWKYEWSIYLTLISRQWARK